MIGILTPPAEDALKLSRRKTWSPLEEQTLRTMAEAGKSAVQIAARLGRSIMAVKDRAKVQGVKITTVRERRAMQNLRLTEPQ